MDARNLDERSESRMSLDLSPIDTELKELARAILEPLDLKLYELEGMSVFEVRPDRFEYGTSPMEPSRSPSYWSFLHLTISSARSRLDLRSFSIIILVRARDSVRYRSMAESVAKCL